MVFRLLTINNFKVLFISLFFGLIRILQMHLSVLFFSNLHIFWFFFCFFETFFFTFHLISFFFFSSSILDKNHFDHSVAISSILIDWLPRLGCIFAAIKLHYKLLSGITHAPIVFFDQTPSGRILSRFSKDIDVLDNVIPTLLSDLLQCAFEVISSLHFRR